MDRFVLLQMLFPEHWHPLGQDRKDVLLLYPVMHLQVLQQLLAHAKDVDERYTISCRRRRILICHLPQLLERSPKLWYMANQQC